MSDMISKQAAVSIPVLPKEYREYQTMNLDDAYELGWYDLQKCIEKMPSAEPEPCEDAVSREAVSEWLKQYGQDVLHGKYKFSLMYIWKNLMDLPSVQPQRMRGRWEPKIDRWGDTLTLTEGYNCSECHAWVDGEYSYCPWCGADMREGEQDEYQKRTVQQGMQNTG